MTSFSTQQKQDLEHYIINTLSNPEMARLLKLVNCTEEEIISMPKMDAITIIECLKKIRKFILELPCK